MSRHKYNTKILEALKIYIDKYPDLRFIQALWNLRLVDRNTDKFYEESEVTYNHIIDLLTK